MKNKDTNETEVLELLRKQDAVNKRKADNMRRQSRDYRQWGGWSIIAGITVPVLLAMATSSEESAASEGTLSFSVVIFGVLLIIGLVLNFWASKLDSEANALYQKQESDDNFDEDYL